MIVRENPTPHNPHVFIRGNHNRPGDEVPRQFLRVVAGENRQPFRQGSGRLELAQAVIASENPLTARVIVNRVWMHHFGSPLVATPSDFGLRSERPVQADTLDHLASQFRDGRLVPQEVASPASCCRARIDKPVCRAGSVNKSTPKTHSTGAPIAGDSSSKPCAMRRYRCPANSTRPQAVGPST